MKRLSALVILTSVLSLTGPTLHARPVASHIPEAMKPTENGPYLPEAPPDPEEILVTRSMLTEGARNAAHVIRRRIDALQPESHPPADQPSTADTVATGPGRSKSIGIGFLATLPTAGVSAIVNLSSRTAAQGLLGLFLGGMKTVTGRYLFYFRETTHFQPYIFGEAGAWSYEKQVVFGFGGGGGLEYFIERYPFVSISLEMTLREIGFSADVYDISGLAIGGGVHWYF